MKKKNVAVYVGVVLVGLFAVWLLRGCDVYDSTSIRFGAYKALRVSRAETKEALREVERQRDIIAKKDSIIGQLNGSIGQTNAAIGKKDEEIAGLERRLAAAATDSERVILLSAEVVALKEKFSLAQGVISDQQSVIFALTAKYDAAVVIGDKYRGLYEKTLAQAEACDELRKSLARDLRLSRLLGRVKTGVIVGVIVGVAYVAFKK
jgi:hypothetical protein